MNEEFTAEQLHRYSLRLWEEAFYVKRMNDPIRRDNGDLIDLMRRAVSFERRAYVRCKNRSAKKTLFKNYKFMQFWVRHLAWRGNKRGVRKHKELNIGNPTEFHFIRGL